MLEVDPIKETNANDRSFDKVQTLRSVIDAKLHEPGIYEQIRELVNAKISFDDREGQPKLKKDFTDDEAVRSKEEHLIHEILQSEVVQQLLASVRSDELKTRENVVKDGDEDVVDLENKREVVLYLRLSGGKAFVDQLLDLEQSDGNISTNEETDAGGPKGEMYPVGSVIAFYRVNASFQKQRQKSRDVQCCVDPPFDAHFCFRVEKKRSRPARSQGGASHVVDVVSPWEALCLVEEPVQLDLIKVTKKLLKRGENGTANWREISHELVAVHRLDWRRTLCSTLDFVHFPVELIGQMKEPVGILDFRADLYNCKRTATIAREARSFLNKEALQRNASNHCFYKYAKQWWDEFRSEVYDDNRQSPNKLIDGFDSVDEHEQLLAQIGSRQRLVKLFGEDEEGRYRMICKFIVPLRAPMAVRSPSEAVRFVSLLPYESSSLVGGGSDEMWRSIAAILSVRKGDAKDHAVLLASLLLGCGLDAYVCIGTISASKSASRFARGSQRNYEDRASAEVGHVWVLTRDSSLNVLLWEAVTGENFGVNDTRAPKRRGYCAIDCLFNHRRFFANLQPLAWKLSESSFDFEDETCWKRMDENIIDALPFGQPPTAILPPDVISASMQEVNWSTTLQQAITSRRRADGLVTRWSEELSYYLLPALNSYEMERLYGITQVDNIFFQQAISNFVHEGHTFQGVPLMFTVESPDEAFDALTSNSLVIKFLTLHARLAQFAIAVRSFPYAEHTVATWVMLAVTYPSEPK